MTIDRPVVIATVAGLALAAVLEFVFVGSPSRYFAGSDLPLFWAGFGLVGCAGIVVVSKWAGHTFLMRHDDPYTGEHVEAEPETGAEESGGDE